VHLWSGLVHSAIIPWESTGRHCLRLARLFRWATGPRTFRGAAHSGPKDIRSAKWLLSSRRIQDVRPHHRDPAGCWAWRYLRKNWFPSRWPRDGKATATTMFSRSCSPAIRPGLLGLGVTALIAGFMSGMAGNVSAFTTVWTYDIYRPLINKQRQDHHYVNMGVGPQSSACSSASYCVSRNAVRQHHDYVAALSVSSSLLYSAQSGARNALEAGDWLRWIFGLLCGTLLRSACGRG